jgi:hypothetical protein
MKLYCNKCYAKTEYKFSKPKFCPECGEKISGSSDSLLLKPKDLEKKDFVVSRKDSFAENEEDNFDEEEEEDYLRTQRYIESFKKNSKRSHVFIEKSNFDGGISFGELMQKASTETRVAKDFSGLDRDQNNKTKDQILEELKLESCSAARVIDIE